MLNPKDWRKFPEWLLGGFWPDMVYKDINGKPLSTKEFGDNKFHGRSHPSVVYMAIERLTELNDLVFIPFSGSGTEIDMCKKLGRRYTAIDLTPQRHDVIHADATVFTIEPPEEQASLVLAHPPYGSAIKFSEKNTDLSKDGVHYEYLVQKCAYNFMYTVKPKGYVVIIVGDTYHDGEEWPLDFVWYQAMKKANFKMVGRIFRSFGETKAKGKNKNLWKYRLFKWNRFYMNTDFVMVFQKPDDDAKTKKLKKQVYGGKTK